MSIKTLQCLNFEQLRLNIDDTTFNNLRLQYRGEGNANLVLYLPEIHFVFRLRKNYLNETIDYWWEKEKLKISFLYYYIFMEPYFSSTYLTIPVLAEVSYAAVKQLDEKLDTERPASRKNKRLYFSGIEIHPDYAFIPEYKKLLKYNSYPQINQFLKFDSSEIFSKNYQNFRNYIFSLLSDNCVENTKSSKATNFCIEIKPKQAFIADSYWKFKVCAFCMNQYLKLSEKKIGTKSQYCPLDLFSGDEVRMRKAIKDLFNTPQNNLKVFRNGEPLPMDSFLTNIKNNLIDLFDNPAEFDDKRSIDHFCSLLMKILTTDFTKGEKSLNFKIQSPGINESKKIINNEFIHLINEAFSRFKLICSQTSTNLPKNCILSCVEKLQRLDEVGLEIVSAFYDKNCSDYQNDFSYLNDLIARCVSDCEEAPELNVLEAYLLSTAAKDLSIMISVQKVLASDQSYSDHIIDIDGFQYEVNVSIVDVGPKPISCLKKHWKRDTQIFSSCLNYFYPDMNLKNKDHCS